ncbi:hypothetical protein DRN87_01950 [Candidatus Geothermarchaeota archaeon]|nr:MAG: hypothetical protein DRN87_01950 [Candidatus Geothermarchaeota archaeon]
MEEKVGIYISTAEDALTEAYNMSNAFNMRNYIDICFNLVDILKRYISLSHYVSLYMHKDEGLDVTFSSDLCLSDILVDHHKMKVTIRTRDLYMPEWIPEIYNISFENKYPNHTGKWLEKSFLEDVMKKYSKAFKVYKHKTKVAEEIAEKYNVDIKTVIDSYGYMYTRLELDIQEKSVKEVSLAIKKGIDIMAEFCTKVTTLPFNKKGSLKEDPLNLICTWLNTSREIYKLLLKDNALEPIHIYVSNYSVFIDGKPYMAIEYPYKNTESFTIIITKEDGEYTLEYVFPKKRYTQTYRKPYIKMTSNLKQKKQT